MYTKPTNDKEFNKNFKDKKPLMNPTEAYYESSRCLFCYDAPCVTACPTGIDIPLFIKQIHTKNITGAAKTIYDANWIGNACGKICPTGVLCEGACVYNHQDISPIEIGRLQNFATANVIQHETTLFEAGASLGKRVAIIGSGPAGLSCASELRTMGYDVTIYEAKAKPSGLTVYGIAPYKITNEEVLDEVNYLQSQLGFNIEYNHPIQTKEEIQKLEQEFDAIFIGVGLGKTAYLGLEGEGLANVIGAVEFVEELRMEKSSTKVGEQVIVIGGGNTAMDAASESARMGASEVTLAYRRDKDSMGAYGFEFDLAVSSGVTPLFNAQPVKLLGDSKVEGVRFVKTENKNGQLHLVEGSEFDVACDMVIKATGQAKCKELFALIDNLELDRRSRIIVKEDNYQTSNPKYFAGGDAVNGGAEVVNAAYEGKVAAQGIDKYLNN